MSFFPEFLIPRSIGQRFALTIGGGAGIILAACALISYLSARQVLLEQTSNEALQEIQDQMHVMDDLIDRVAMLPMAISANETSQEEEGGVTVPWLASLLKQCPIKAVFGLYMILDQQDWRNKDGLLWVSRKSYPHAAQLNYDFHDESHTWYSGAKKSGGLFVTEPYFAEGGSGIDMISITQPVYDREGSFIGVAGADVSLDEIRKIIAKINIKELEKILISRRGLTSLLFSGFGISSQEVHGSAYLLTSQGKLIVGPNWTTEEKPANSSLTLSSDSQDLDPIPPQILSSTSGSIMTKDGKGKVLYWAEGKLTHWKLVLEVPYSLIVAPARDLATQSILFGCIGLLLLLGVVYFIAGRVSGPIQKLQEIAIQFEKGSYGKRNFALERMGARHDELGRFAKSFSAMTREIQLREERLSEWNTNLEQTVRERTADLARAVESVEKSNRAMAAEIAEAAAYSRAVLPPRVNGPVATDWVFETSTELGGDTFGYHWLDDDHFAIYLLDVCGHGVGAALLSVTVVDHLRTTSLSGCDFMNPSSVLSGLNAAFPMERHNDMYFTVWYGVFSLSSREILYASGGHPPAILITREGQPIRLGSGGSIVGVFPAATYENAGVIIPEGSRLYLFSDGVYEIDRPGLPMMTYDEFVEILRSKSGKGTLDAIVSEIQSQQGKKDFTDDFSLVEFEFSAIESPCQFSLKNDLSELRNIPGRLESFGRAQNLPDQTLYEIEVILEELASNVIKYGGSMPGDECCLIELLKSDTYLTIRFSDWGIRFNPLGQSEVDTSKPISERPIGGLGIHFIKKLTDSQHYEFRNGKNVLTLTKKLKAV
jgi:serine phosphatase RsbU (regulator of sigma subunit)/anti-sigma regulatory factor (Ser/Thr protein kinase)